MTNKGRFTIEIEKREGSFIEWSHGDFWRKITKLWINPNNYVRFSKGEETRIFTFPIKGRLMRNGNDLIFRPRKDGIVYFAEIKSGYRGEACIASILGGEIILRGFDPISPRRKLGETAWALINAQEGMSIKIRGYRTGEGITREAEEVNLEIGG